MDNKLFYSVNSYLAWYISKKYYSDIHFVWCAPVFDPTKLDANDPLWCIHDSSSPKHIYEVFKREIESNDITRKIQENKNGLINGMNKRFIDKLLTPNEVVKITSVINKAPIEHFRPRLYLIPATDEIRNRVIEVDVDLAANPLSTEYQIHDLKGNEFEIIEY